MGAECDRGSALQQLREKPSVRDRQGSRLRSSSTEVGQMKWMLFPWRQCPQKEMGPGVLLRHKEVGCEVWQDAGWDGAVRHAATPWGILSPSLWVRGAPSQIRAFQNIPALPAWNYEPRGLIVGLLFLPSQVGSPEQPAPLSWNGGSTESVSLE